MKVLVTGGTGFIGARLVSALLDQGCFVRVLTRKSELPGFYDHENVEIVNIDLLDPQASFSSCLMGCSVIFNCAGELKDESRMRLLHVDATMRLIKAARKYAETSSKYIRWVQLSSVGAYGSAVIASSDRVVTEESIPSPVGTYEVTKTEIDELLMREGGKFFSYSILRPSNVYGAGMPNDSLRQWALMIKKKMFFFIGKPGAVSTYVHVDDVVAALILCGFSKRAEGEVFNISNDCSQEQLVCALAREMNVAPPRLRLPEWSLRLAMLLFSRVKRFPISNARIDALVSRTRYPSTKLAIKLGYEPKHMVADTIGEIFRNADGVE